MNRILKVACIFEGAHIPYLFELDQRREIQDVVREICEHVNKPNHTQYAFKSVETINAVETETYITEKNRGNLHDGTVLKLVKSPEGAALELVEELSAGRNPSVDVVARLNSEAIDVTFAKIFVDKQGLPDLKRIIDDGISKKHDLDKLGLALSALYRLMVHRVVRSSSKWSDYSDGFFHEVMSFITHERASKEIQRSALQIAAAFVIHTEEKRGFQIVYNSPHLENFSRVPINTGDSGIQEASVMLINAIVSRCPLSLKSEVLQRLERLEVKKALADRVRDSTRDVPPSLAHELYVLQTHLLSEKADRAKYDFQMHDQSCVAALATLKDTLAQYGDSPAGLGDSTMAALGFKDPNEPHKDFIGYPGVLALDGMAYFAKNSEDLYKKMVLDQLNRAEEYLCPFVQTSKRLTILLLDILDVGNSKSDAIKVVEETDEYSTQYLPLFYAVDHPFEELFGVGIQLLHKTWKEMEAKSIDIEKVVNVVRRQLLEVMSNPDKMPSDVKMFQKMVFMHSYEDAKAGEEKKMEENFHKQLMSDALVDIKVQIRDDMTAVVREQRLSYMVEGAWFCPIIKGKIKHELKFFVMLTPNHKEIKWNDPEDDSPMTEAPTLADLPKSLEVESIVWFEVATEVPAMKEIKNKKTIDDYQRLTFAINLGQEEWLNCVALDRETAAIWMDGLRMLLGKISLEQETRSAVDHLVDMQMALVLMNMHGVTIPPNKPDVPQLPPDPEAAPAPVTASKTNPFPATDDRSSDSEL